MKAPVATQPLIHCKHCMATTKLSATQARVAGWRMYSGPSITGKQLNDVICPACTGQQTPVEVGATWLVRCNTCEWEVGEDEDEDEDGAILTYKEAVSAYNFHDCEPEIQLRPPGDDEWYDRYDFDRDGTLKAGVR